MDILRLVCQGLSNHEIADQLVLSVGTVKFHIHNIFGKLGVRDRPQAIAKAGLLGVGDQELSRCQGGGRELISWDKIYA